MNDFKILWVNPLPTPKQRCNHLQTISFRVCLRTNHSFESTDFIVRLWTNLFHKENNEGEWHVVSMPYQSVSVKSDNGTMDHLFGVDLFITCTGTYGFNYRALCRRTKKSARSESSGQMEVNPPCLRSPLTEWIQYPMEAQITSNIWMGNHAAALTAPQRGYDCLLNAADDAPVFVLQLNRPILLRKFPIGSGANNTIRDKMLYTAVRWLWEASLRCDKILIFSKYCQARAASIMIAYVYARNPDLPFDDAVRYVDSRMESYYHKGLKEALTRLFPRG